jgi:hypothetical protein
MITTAPDASKNPNAITPSWLIREKSLFNAKKSAARQVSTIDNENGSNTDANAPKL